MISTSNNNNSIDTSPMSALNSSTPNYASSDLPGESQGNDWWSRNDKYFALGGGIVAGIITGLLTKSWQAGAAVASIGTGIYTAESTKDLQTEQWKKENEEYDRRVQNANEYNEDWYSRALNLGINPLSLTGSGSANSNYTASAPSPGPRVDSFNPSQAMSTSMELSALQNQAAQTQYIREQTNAQHQEGYAQFMANCFTRLQAGDKGDFVGKQTISFEPRYRFRFDESGNYAVEKVSPSDAAQMKASFNKDGSINIEELTVSSYVFDSPDYGKFTIRENSYAVKMLNEQLTKAIGENNSLSMSISSALLDAYYSAIEATNDGKRISILEYEKNCKALATLFMYGRKEDAPLVGLPEGEYNPSNWKWWASFITEKCQLNFGSILDFLPNIGKFINKVENVVSDTSNGYTITN